MLATSARTVPPHGISFRQTVVRRREGQLAAFTLDSHELVHRADQGTKGALTLIDSPDTLTSTPWGWQPAFFQRGTLCVSPSRVGLGDVAEHFAANTGSARLAVGHHAFAGGDDGNAQAVHDLRNVVPAPL